MILPLATLALGVAPLIPIAIACDGCYGSQSRDITLTRHRPRMQPDAQTAVALPRGPLEWGQINFLHTTDTHGWLEGHLKEQNYGADWGDFVSFVKHINQTAVDAGVDVLLVDTGDLHDGAGLSDATQPNGNISNPIFENINYDLLSIGNHELYVTEIAYETFNQFSKQYGERYLTSNVQILNPSTSQFEYIGHQYRYFTTRMGLRIMSFGFLYDFTGNSNVSKVITANESVSQQWFKDAVNYKDPIDLFVVLGHNPPRPTVGGSTFGTIFNAIRTMRPNVPIQIFGGHTHVRDFVVYDGMATGLESGRYCETLGWLAMDGLSAYKDVSAPSGLPHPTQSATKVFSTASSTSSTASIAQRSVTESPSTGASPTASPAPSNSNLAYARRYLDWNRLTFEYHANTSQVNNTTPASANDFVGRDNDSRRTSNPRRRQVPDDGFDTPEGTAVTNTIYQDRQQLNLTNLYGCAPQNWCQACAPFLSPTNIYSLLTTALQQTVINPNRTDTPRMIILNTGSTRFDLFKGPFTYDDSFIVSPFDDTFQFIPDVPTPYAAQILAQLDQGSVFKRHAEPSLSPVDFPFDSTLTVGLNRRESCPNPPSGPRFHDAHAKRGGAAGRIRRRQTSGPDQTSPGYTTSDDFGTDGDDTLHSAIPHYAQPNYFQANASFPPDGSAPPSVDLVFLDYFASSVVRDLATVGAMGFTQDSVQNYLPPSFTTNSYLPAYAQMAADWQRDVPNCPVL